VDIAALSRTYVRGTLAAPHGCRYSGLVQLAFTTVDEFFALLEQAGEPLDYREVWPRLFPVSNCPLEFMRSLVADIVHADERFTWESDVLVGLTHWRAERRDLSHVVFTVVDLETTGSVPGFAKITEIGAVRIEAGRQVATFSQLVDPGVSIPTEITQITGITDTMVAGQPGIRQVLPRFVDFSRDSVLVAHNARFDLGFLDYELGMLSRQTFPRPALDTLRLARRLLTRRSCALASLAEYFDTAARPSHRALDDARATAEILLLLLARVEEQGVTTLEEVVRLCEPGARRNYHKIVLTERLPTTPGVYMFRDGHGAALYIGKAENLRRRARDHFLQKQAYGARQALELLESIDHIDTGSEFAALLLEQRLIAHQSPPYNSHGTRVSNYHYVKLTADPFPRVYATPNRRDDGSLYAGPFRRGSFAKRFAECVNNIYPLRTCVRLRMPVGDSPERSCLRFDIGACLAPCRTALNGEYADVVDEVRRVLNGDADRLDEALQTRQDEMVRALAFEQAARLQRFRETVSQALRTVRRLASARRTFAVMAYPGLGAGKVVLYGITGGIIVEETTVRASSFTCDDGLALIGRIHAASPPSVPLPVDCIDEVLLVHGWLRRHRAAINVLDLPTPDCYPAIREAAARELVARLPLCARSGGGPAPNGRDVATSCVTATG
jgi:DNA polymerase III subunit epsilon